MFADIHGGQDFLGWALDEVTRFLAARGVGKEQFPEHLVQLDELPRSSGGKVAKGELRADIRRRLGAGQA